jgi:hypothetical protein
MTGGALTVHRSGDSIRSLQRARRRRAAKPPDDDAIAAFRGGRSRSVVARRNEASRRAAPDNRDARCAFHRRHQCENPPPAFRSRDGVIPAAVCRARCSPLQLPHSDLWASPLARSTAAPGDRRGWRSRDGRKALRSQRRSTVTKTMAMAWRRQIRRSVRLRSDALRRVSPLGRPRALQAAGRPASAVAGKRSSLQPRPKS